MDFSIRITEDAFEISVGIDAAILLLLLQLLGFATPYVEHVSEWLSRLHG